jgi:serine/threonine protein kinase/WD40 repeat protein
LQKESGADGGRRSHVVTGFFCNERVFCDNPAMTEKRQCPNGHLWETTLEGEPAPVCPHCGSMALTEHGDALPPAPPPAAALPHIPGYEVLENLGPGGMGVVFKARQLRPSRLVALKMIKEGLYASPTVRERFRREAEAVARLRHPNIVPIHEFGEHDGYPFFTMEYVEGGTLQSRLGGAPQSPRESAHLVEILARAVHAAHLCHIIHRDLKPSNILLQGEPASGMNGSSVELSLTAVVPKIADFGLAKIMEGPADLTPTLAVLGTVGYMPPEQAAGKSKNIGPPADVYSLGAILYQMLTGRPPFHGESTVEVLLQVVQEEPIPPRRLRPALPIDLETICLACLEKDPTRRYHSALELAEDLRRFQAHEPILRRPVGPVGRLARWSRRNPALAISGGSAAALLLAVTILSVIFGVTQARSGREIDERRRLAERRLAENLLERGQTLAEQGEHGKALVSFARGLELLPVELVDLERVFRLNMGASFARLHRLLELFPPPESAHGVVYSADGKSLITGGHDNRGRIWDLATGTAKELVHQGPVWHAALSPDGNKVATASEDSTAALWDRHTGQRLFTLPHTPKQIVWAVGFTRDGKWLVTGAEDPHICVWDVASGRKVQELVPKEKDLQAHKTFRFAFSHDGKRLATAHGPKVVFWRLPEGTEARASQQGIVLIHGGEVHWLRFSPDDRRFLTAGLSEAGAGKYSARLWDPASGEPVGEAMQQDHHIRSALFSPDGESVLLACQHGTCLYDTLGKPKLRPIREAHSQRALFHPTKPFFFSADFAGSIQMWQIGTGKRFGAPLRACAGNAGLACAPDGSTLAVAGNRALGLYQLNFAPAERFAQPHPETIHAVAFHPDGKTFLTACENKIRFWDTASGKQLPLELSHSGRVPSAFYSKDGMAVLGAGDSGETVLWDIDGTGARKRYVKQACFRATRDPEGKFLAGVAANQVLLWDFASGKLVQQWRDGHDLHHVVFANRELLVTGSSSDHGTIKFWHVPSGKQRGPTIHYDRGITGLTTSGNLLFVGFLGGTVKIWDWTTGAVVGNPWRHTTNVCLAVHRDGKLLVTGTDQMVQLWDHATARRLGPPLYRGGPVGCLAISPTEDLVLSGGAASNQFARLQSFPREVTVPRQHAVLWSRVVTGLEADDQGGVQPVDPKEWRGWREELKALGVRLDD